MTLAERINFFAPESLALLAPREDCGERPPLQFGQLSAIMIRTARQLLDLGITPQDRIALVLPNCPEMAALFLAVVDYGCAAPLNPAYRADELRFYLTDLSAKAVVIAAGAENSAAAEVAREQGIMVLVMAARSDLAVGHFDLVLQGMPRVARLAPSTPLGESKTSLILHTSGTTARPKIVPLTCGNLLASAGNIAATLKLAPADRLLGIMPLFHIHGLMAGLLAPLLAGSSVFVTPGFNGLRFYGWLEESELSWYTAVPTMHSTILARSLRNRAAIESSRGRLRFIRSSSSALAPKLLHELETIFACPVVESYGMTEASHQMASTSL
ncbi:MAG: AMP-binding protein, partial [Candidatus Pacebacteria bacterium]|nr:AMP-binding protein [Candidatus Paceibacterota bacterium]